MAVLLIMGELNLQPSPEYSAGDAKLGQIRCRRLCEAESLEAEGFNAECTDESRGCLTPEPKAVRLQG